MRWLRALALAGALAGCAAPPLPPPVADTGPKTAVLYIIAEGWHTEIALPVPALQGKIATLDPARAGARYVVFGWGARDYYMAADPGVADALAAVMPGPAVMLVVPLAVTPAQFAGGGKAVALAVSEAGIGRVSRRLWDELAKDSAGVPRPLGAGPYRGSEFYAATGRYDLARTCNTWTAEMLEAAGLPVSPDGVVFAGQVLDRLPQQAAAAADQR